MPAGVGRACWRGSGVFDLSDLDDCTIAAIRKAPGVECMEVDGTPPRVEDEGEAPEFWDEISGEILPAHLVQASRAEALKFMDEWEVLEEAPVKTEQVLFKMSRRERSRFWRRRW